MECPFLRCGAALALATSSLAAHAHATTGICSQWRHGRCLSWDAIPHRTASAKVRGVGDHFGPSQHYVALGALPRPLVERYQLGSDFRYVDEGGHVYVVDPHSYRVVRVIPTS